MTAGRLLAASSLVVLLSTACTPAAAPQPTPTPAATPSETAQEREQRIAYAAAEKSYGTFRAELQRVTDAGGATKPTPTMIATAGGSYLRDFANLVAAYHQQHYRTIGKEKIVFVRGAGYSSSEVALTACEDSRSVTTYSARRSVIGKGELRLTTIQVRNIGGSWKVWSGNGDKVNSCE